MTSKLTNIFFRVAQSAVTFHRWEADPNKVVLPVRTIIAEFPSLYQYNTYPLTTGIYMYMYTCIHIYIHVYIHIYIYIMYIYICMYIYVCIYIYPKFHISVYIVMVLYYINPNPHSYWISKPVQLWLHQKVHVTTHAPRGDPRHRGGENATAKS